MYTWTMKRSNNISSNYTKLSNISVLFGIWYQIILVGLKISSPYICVEPTHIEYNKRLVK